MTIRLQLVLFVVLMAVCQSCKNRVEIAAKEASLEIDIQNAREEIERIVNQPVTAIRATDGMQISLYQPGWFHAGAGKPDFNNVDVRKTQDTSYGKHEYVTSDLNPGLAFRGADVEFNPSTKYFYTDLTVPKKKLSEDEMVEINRLYRIIGRSEKELAELRK